MNGQKKQKNWFAEMAFKALRSNPEWAARFEQDFGMKVDEMQQGYMKRDEKFCSAIKRRGAELAQQMPEQFHSVQAFAEHGDNFSDAGAPGIPNNNYKLERT